MVTLSAKEQAQLDKLLKKRENARKAVRNQHRADDRVFERVLGKGNTVKVVKEKLNLIERLMVAVPSAKNDFKALVEYHERKRAEQLTAPHQPQ